MRINTQFMQYNVGNGDKGLIQNEAFLMIIISITLHEINGVDMHIHFLSLMTKTSLLLPHR